MLWREYVFFKKNNNHLLQLGKALKDATGVWRQFKTLKMGTEAAVIGRAVSHWMDTCSPSAAGGEALNWEPTLWGLYRFSGFRIIRVTLNLFLKFCGFRTWSVLLKTPHSESSMIIRTRWWKLISECHSIITGIRWDQGSVIAVTWQCVLRDPGK